MNTGNLALIALALLSTVSCAHTRFSKYDATTGKKTMHFSTRANIGYTTDYVEGSNSKTSGATLIPGGSYDNRFTTKSTAVASGNASDEQIGLQIGGVDGLSIYGVIDHATVTDREGHWFYRIVRAVATAAVFWKGIGTWGDIETGKTAADVSNTKTGSKVEINDSNNALKKGVDDNATKVKLQELAVPPPTT